MKYLNEWKRWLNRDCRTTLMIVLILDAEIVNISETVKELTKIRCNSQDRGFCAKHLGHIFRAKILNMHIQNTLI